MRKLSLWFLLLVLTLQVIPLNAKGELDKIIQMAKREASDFIDVSSLDSTKVIVLKDWSQLRDYNINKPPEWGIALAVPYHNTIFLKEEYTLSPSRRLQQILVHEFIHIANHYRAGRNHLPTWYDEGIAQMGSDRDNFLGRFTISISALRNKIRPLSQLEYSHTFFTYNPNYSYAASLSACQLISKMFGFQTLLSIMDSVKISGDFTEGFYMATNMELLQFYRIWREYILKKYRILFLVSQTHFLWTFLAFVIIILGIYKLIWTKIRIKRMRDEENSPHIRIDSAEDNTDSDKSTPD